MGFPAGKSVSDTGLDDEGHAVLAGDLDDDHVARLEEIERVAGDTRTIFGSCATSYQSMALNISVASTWSPAKSRSLWKTSTM